MTRILEAPTPPAASPSPHCRRCRRRARRAPGPNPRGALHPPKRLNLARADAISVELGWRARRNTSASVLRGTGRPRNISTLHRHYSSRSCLVPAGPRLFGALMPAPSRSAPSFLPHAGEWTVATDVRCRTLCAPMDPPQAATGDETILSTPAASVAVQLSLRCRPSTTSQPARDPVPSRTPSTPSSGSSKCPPRQPPPTAASRYPSRPPRSSEPTPTMTRSTRCASGTPGTAARSN
ncbi:hypothetical protein EDB83DRAFT_2402847 [Lactarius deliciosus]|nr:hypothetical protein EDB83DRAFT_2454609 [Lactarius deliciosus]KAH9048008.1 hypothetical protein EDB83DRAFT_2402847 [Lactarius deliciosus]